MHSINENPETVDEQTVIFYLDVPGNQVVFLQGFFELYEGVGLVRTLDIKRSLVSVVTTPSMKEECLNVLNDIQPKIGWRYAEPSAALNEQKSKIFGYGGR